MSIIFNMKEIYKYSDNGVDKLFCYLGDSDNSHQIYGGEIGPIDNNRQYIPLTNGMHEVLFLDNLLIINPDTITSPLYIRGKRISISSIEFQQLSISMANLLLEKHNKIILSTINNNFNNTTQKLKNITLPEKIIRLLVWDEKKSNLKFNYGNLLNNIYINEIYYAYYGCNIGSEMEKLRPVLIWQEHKNKNNTLDSSYFVFPITSKPQKKKYIGDVEININGKKNHIKVLDGRRISIKRILKPLLDQTTKQTYKITPDIELAIKDAISKYFKIK